MNLYKELRELISPVQAYTQGQAYIKVYNIHTEIFSETHKIVE